MKKNSCKNNQHFQRKAFTFVELLVAIGLILILFVVLLSRVDFSTNKTKATGAQTDLRTYSIATQAVIVEKTRLPFNLATLASELNANLDASFQLTAKQNYLESSAYDQWGMPYIAINAQPVGSNGEVTFVSAGPDNKYFTEDDVAVIVTCKGENAEIVFPLRDPHDHKFEEYADGYAVKISATCVSQTTYLKSCIICKMKSIEEFNDGSIDSNNHSNIKALYTNNNDGTHSLTRQCTDCNTVMQTSSEQHSFRNGKCLYCDATTHVHTYNVDKADDSTLVNSATCSAPATYYYSCSCGAIGTRTFQYGDPSGHTYTAEIEDEKYLKSEFAQKFIEETSPGSAVRSASGACRFFCGCSDVYFRNV